MSFCNRHFSRQSVVALAAKSPCGKCFLNAAAAENNKLWRWA